MKNMSTTASYTNSGLNNVRQIEEHFMDIGHWTCEFDFNPDEWFGFIYRIMELHTGKEYIGKKQFKSLRRKIIKGRVNRKHVISDSNWKTYTGSSEHLNKSIEEFGKDNYLFIIESLHKTRGSLHYAEVQKQVEEDVLRATLLDNRTRKYYNGHIAAIKFIPPAEHSEETKKKMRQRWADMPYQIKEEWCNKYVRGDNQPSKRSKTPEEYNAWLDKYFRGENNPMYGKPPHNKGATYEELYGDVRADAMKKHLSSLPKKIGSDHPFFGKERPLHVKEKISNSNKGKQAGEKNPMYGKPCFLNMSSDEIDQWKKNISNATKGRPKSDSMKKKLSASTVGKKKDTVACPHCGKIGGVGNMKRYHFDHCKSYTAGT